MISIDSTEAALVSKENYWRPIDKDTPIGVKLLVINKPSGVLTSTVLGSREPFFTHYYPVPSFNPNERE